MDEICVVLAFFSPVNYSVPKQHFITVMHSMHAQGIPLAVVQAIYPGQDPVPVPSSIPQTAIKTESLLFHKERLWNIGSKITKAEKLVFLDADVIFQDTQWLGATADCLERNDIVQPFETAIWQDKTGRDEMIRPSFAEAINRSVTPKLAAYHPGFGWGFRREAFEKLGGFYDASVAGNSDALFALSLRDSTAHSVVETWYAKLQDPHVHSPTYRRYKKIAAHHNFKVGWPAGVVLRHMYHGERKNRQYITRAKLFPRDKNENYEFVNDSNGLQAWKNLEDSNSLVRSYFIDKKDDQ